MLWAALLFLAAGQELQEPDSQGGCWNEDKVRSRCCYGGPIACSLEEKCCAYRSLNYGHPGLPGLEGLPSELFHRLRVLFRSHGKALTRGGAAMAAEWLRRARKELDNLRNVSRAFPGQLPDMSAAYQAFLAYFVVFFGLRKRLSSAVISALLSREPGLWLRFQDIYAAAWGQRDFCRCVEAGEFFARSQAQFEELGVGQRHFLQRFLNGSEWQHHAISLQRCDKNEDDMVHPRAIQLMASSSQCVPGNLASLIILLHSCILEQDLRKTFMLSAGIFQLATFAAECLDAQYWGFTARDAVLHHARLIWEVVRGQVRAVQLQPMLLKRFAWNAFLNRKAPALQVSSSSTSSCGPHEVGSSTIGVAKLGRFTYGPLCTELGRFWLQAEILKDQRATDTKRVLAIIPVTMAGEANPWHHLHWWLPALWFYKLKKQIDASHLEVALVFPHEEIDWATSTARGRVVDATFRGHTEPREWSFLQPTWPRQSGLSLSVSEHFVPPHGVHAGVLQWLSELPPRPLQSFEGESYGNVILGLPSLRFFLRTPEMSCHQVSALRRFLLRSFPDRSELVPERGSPGSSPHPLQLALLQRPAGDGRQIENFEEVQEFLRSNFSELQLKVIQHLSGLPWVDQFRMFIGADLLVAVHGAGMAWLWAMRPKAAVIELRSRSSPMWLHCSEIWNTDGSQIFGGLARLVGMHHICTRPHDLPGTVEQARLSKIGDMTEEDAYNHSDNVVVFLPKLAMLLRSENSEAPDAKRGGDIGWISKGKAEPRLEAVALTTPRGACSPAFLERPGCFQMVYVEDREGWHHETSGELIRVSLIPDRFFLTGMTCSGRTALIAFLQLSLRLASGFNISELEIIVLNASDPLFSDANVRMSQDGSCGAGTVPGSVRPATQGREIHPPDGVSADWTWSDSGTQYCATDSCAYRGDLGSGSFWCPLAPGDTAERLKCECEQCPCPAGTGGFQCVNCETDEGCGEGGKCIRSMLLDGLHDKRFSCKFDEDLERSSTYRLFWSGGWSSPQFFAQYFPSQGIARLDIINTMCSHRQPILMQCGCTACDSLLDDIDPITGEQSGACTDANVPSPCARCEKCECTYPDDSWLSSFTRIIVDGIRRGVLIGCEDTGNCHAVLDDLPAPLSFDCQTGMCIPDNSTEEVVLARRSIDLFGQWTTVALLILSLVVLLSLFVLLCVVLDCLRTKRLADGALLDMPGAPLPAIAAAQAALGGFGSTPPGATLVFSWQNINCARKDKKVLQNVSGSVETLSSGRGALVALLGPSGSGKTTLLEALAGRMQPGDSGEVRINGKEMSARSRRRHVSFVYQDEILGATLTVREALEFSAALRLRSLSAAKRAGRVSWALKMLKLEEVADSKIGDSHRRGISGGERRRVAIGVELVVSPPIMVLDEPTTGLDASCALMLGRVLAQLAEGGRLLICSMHQPRAELLLLFNARLDLGQYGDQLTKTTDPWSHKEEEDWSPERVVPNERLGHLGQDEDTSNVNPELVEEIKKVVSRQSFGKQNGCMAGVFAGFDDDLSDALAIASRATAGASQAGLTLQVFLLWQRSLREATRGNYAGVVAAVVVLTIAFLVGFTFRNLDTGIVGVQNRFGSIFFTQLFFSFFGLQACTLWYVDRDRLDRERASKLYNVMSYFLAKGSAYLWWYCIFVPAMYVGIVYNLIGFQGSISKMLTFYLATAGTTAAASGVSLLCLSLTSSFANGISLAAIFLTVLQMYAGFLQRRDAIPWTFRWLNDVSPFAHAFAAMISSEFTGLVTTVEATGHSAVTVSGGIWPQQFNVDPTRMEHNLQMLGIVAGSIWILAFVPLWLRWYRVKTYHRCFRPTTRDRPSDALEAPSWVSGRAQGSAALIWQDLRATLPNGAGLYDGMTGIVHTGRPLAVLGPSGCGKTTLLSCLSGEVTKTKWTGSICLNRQKIARRKLRRTVGYVRQDDALHPELTVSEVISFVWVSAVYAQRRVTWTLHRLGLEAVANSKIGGHKFRGISGGERRRAAVGVELAVARGVLALDEPTSGLDSSSALALGSLLAELAGEGVILLASMHQPSPDLLAYFSSTLVLGAHGRVAYFGPSEQLPTYVSPFRKLNPGVSSASDLLLDVVSGPHQDKVFGGFHESKHADALQEDIQRVLMMASEDDMEVKSAAMPPVWAQLRQLLLRELQISRSLAAYTYFEATIAGVLLGATYYQMSYRLAGVISRLGLIFAVHCTLGMQALQGLLAWRDGYTSYRRERAAGYYYTGSFVIAKVVVDAILLRVGPPALMCILVYLLAGMHPGREAVCCLGFCLASFVSSTFCLALGATAPRSGVVLPLAVLLILIFLLFGGPLLASGDDVLRNISIFRASFNMLAANELRGLDFVFDPEGVSTTLGSRSGEDWMTDLGIKDNPIGEEVGWLLGWSFFYILVAWAVLAARSVTSSDFSLLSLFWRSVAYLKVLIYVQNCKQGRRRSTASE
ncbi:atrA [Symbiodinium necroappetens]|uniref:AtrA protein n=1 Tax=Symbiodinium necroappetens TaxID=1628268 RepID=A0A812TR09_9DINO|nr:atrA [Symbiodinium necroappetens]